MKITYLLLTLLAFNVMSAIGQTADFTYTTPNNQFCSPQVVTFSNTSTGTPVGYIWDFGDGLSGTNSVENHLYDYPGTYTVTFTAVYANNAASVTKTVIINPSPTMSISASKTILCQPENISFTASLSGTTNSYEWDFGDGVTQTTSTNTTSHTYTGYGSFTASVKASTANGCGAAASQTISISRFPINVSVNPLSGCIPTTTVLNATTSFPPGDGLNNIVWNFGDGTPNVTGSNPTVVHAYNVTTTITTANVSVTSNQGCTNQLLLPQFAYGFPPSNTNAYPTALRDTFCGSETIEFYGFADNANLYRWDFGDGTVDTTSSTTIFHKFSIIGNQNVTLTPYFNGCAGPSRTLNLFITGVIASFDFSNTCSNKATYNFQNSSQGNISSYAWSYSDVPGFFETTVYNPTHTFPSNSTSTVKLVLADNLSGCSDSLTRTIYTATPVMISDKIDVCRDSTITYTVQSTYPPNAGYNYQYHSNGTVANTGLSTYTNSAFTFGTFNDYVIISDSIPGTCDDTLYVGPINVRGPVVNFTHVPIRCVDSSVLFTNNTYPLFPEDSIVKWRWDYRDGQKDSLQHPLAHFFQTSGHHSVKLEATDINGCTLEFQSIIYNAPLSEITVFPKIDSLCLGQSATLTAHTADSLIWLTTNNMNCTTCDTVIVNPTVDTDYIAMGITEYGCKGYDTITIRVFSPLNLTVTPAQTSVCAGTPVQLNLNVGGLVSWSPPTFLNNATIQNPISTPTSDVTYTVRVKDSVGCFTDSVTATITVFPDPVVDAGPDQLLPYNTTFTLSPVYAPGTTTYLWSPAGNLSCTNCANPTGVALERQEFTIEVTDINNCTGKDKVTIFVGCELSNLLLPTAFTPNNDGRNEYFYPIARGYKEIKSFTIFNRGGTKVFEKKNFQPNISSEGWDGRIKNGKGDNTQSYVWIIEGICDTGASIVTKGSVLLIR